MPLSEASVDIVKRDVEQLPSRFARLYSNFVLQSTRRPGMPHWQPAEAQQREGDAYRLAALGFALLDENDSRAAATLRRAAELFEWLSVDGHGDSTLLSVMLYQIAGYPAIARSLSSVHSETDAISRLARGEFKLAETDVIRLCNVLGRDPLVIERPEGEREFFQAVFASAASMLLAYMRWGDAPFDQAISQLDAVARYFMLASDHVSWLLARCFSTMARRYIEASLRRTCSGLMTQLSPSGRTALERYVREAYVNEKPIAWPSQVLGVNALVENQDFAMCTPTGSGKTTIAELAIIQALFLGSDNFLSDAGFGRLVIYIVPSRALAHEVERRLRVAFRHANSFAVQVVSSYGGSDVSPMESWLTSQRATVLVCTQEKADALIRAGGAFFLNRLKLIIIDEAHAVLASGDDYERPLRLETLIARLRALTAGSTCRVIALSAVLNDARSLTRWINPQSEKPVFTDYRSTRQAFGRLTLTSAGQIDLQYDMLNGALLGENSVEFRPTLKQFVPNYTHRLERSTAGPEVQLRALALWVAAHLASLDRPDSGSVLITVGTQINHYAKDFIGLLNAWEDLPRFFDAMRANNDDAYTEALESCADYFGRHSYEYRLLTNGIVVHHGKVPLRMANAFTRLVEMRLVRIVVATSTLSEGVNLPFETVLFPSLRGPTGDMPAEYIRNVVGRAGRPGVAREGRALVLVGTGQRFRVGAQRYRQIVDRLSGALQQARPSSALGIIFGILARKWGDITGGNKFEDFCGWLEETSTLDDVRDDVAPTIDAVDQFIISALTEMHLVDGVDLDTVNVESKMKDLWSKTFCYAVNEKSRVGQALFARARRVRADYMRESDIRRSYRSSLGPRSAARLFSHLDDVRDLFNRGYSFLRWEDERRLDFLTDLLLATTVAREFDFTANFSKGPAKWQDVLRWWLKIGEQQPTADKIGQWYSVANKSFAYQGAWAIGSAMLSILPGDEFNDLTLPERLHDSGIPWLALWLRDMLSLGCIDPVQAFVMANGRSTNRDEARDRALEYYSRHEDLSDELLNPKLLLEWLLTTFARPTPPSESNERSYKMHVVAEQISSPQLRVWPQLVDGAVLWRDASGHPIASTILQGPSDVPLSWDYMADCKNRIVAAAPYV